MSSFIGHSLPAFSVYFSGPRSRFTHSSWRIHVPWLLILIIVAWAPDIDHVVPALNAASHHGLRITHSLTACLILPICISLILRQLKLQERQWQILSGQLFLAALSHLVLDVLTGAMWLPLLYPFSHQLFKLPFGLLPSAGKLSFFNYYLYRNLVIELGVLLPLFLSIHRMARLMTPSPTWESLTLPDSSLPASRNRLPKFQLITMVLLGCSGAFMIWAAMLSR